MGRAGPLAIVSPAEFRDRTSLTFSSRSGSTLLLDKAYDAYYKTRSPMAGQALYQQLTAYRNEHGGSWSKSERNKVSGGLLEYLHNSFLHTPGQAAALDKAAADRIRDVEIPHARFGVLYFLANIKMEIDTVGMLIDGAGAIGGAIGVGMSTDFGNLGNAKEAVRAVQTVHGQKVMASHLATGGTQVLKGTRMIVDKLAGPSAPSTGSKLPVTMAALNYVSSTLSEHWDKGRYLNAVAGGAAAVVAAAPGVAVTLVADAAYAVWKAVKSAFAKLGEMLMSAWRSRYDLATAAKLGTFLKKATVIAVDMIVTNAIPFLGGAIDLGTGLAKTIGEAAGRIASWYDKRRIRIQEGHPAEIAGAIEHQMSMGIGAGLYGMLKGAGNVAVSVFVPGLGSLVSVVMSAIEWLVTLLGRIAEQIGIDHFLLRARQLYDTEKRRSRMENGVIEPNLAKGGFITDTKAFTAFFNEGCKASPLIPMLTLNSGLGGSLMTLIKLFDDDGSQSAKLQNGRKEFDIGNDYFTRLKRYSVIYMKKSGFKFLPLVSTDKSIAGYLAHAQGLVKGREAHVEAGTTFGRVAAFAMN